MRKLFWLGISLSFLLVLGNVDKVFASTWWVTVKNDSGSAIKILGMEGNYRGNIEDSWNSNQIDKNIANGEKIILDSAKHGSTGLAQNKVHNGATGSVITRVRIQLFTEVGYDGTNVANKIINVTIPEGWAREYTIKLTGSDVRVIEGNEDGIKRGGCKVGSDGIISGSNCSVE